MESTSLKTNFLKMVSFFSFIFIFFMVFVQLRVFCFMGLDKLTMKCCKILGLFSNERETLRGRLFCKPISRIVMSKRVRVGGVVSGFASGGLRGR